MLSLAKDLPKPLIFGHRGCSRKAPENTLAAFSLIKAHGITGVEMDLHPCSTGEIMVIHDTTLDRTTNGRGSLYQTDLATIKSLDAGSWFGPTFSNQKVPLLEEVFQLLGSHVLYDLEIKRGSYPEEAFLYRLRTLIRDYNLQEYCLVSSFDPWILKKWKTMEPAIPTAQIYSPDKEVPLVFRRGFARAISQADIEKPAHNQILKRGPYSVPRRKRPYLTWTVNDQEEFLRLKDWGVWGVISDCPENLG